MKDVYKRQAYKCTNFYYPNDEGGIAWNDPEIGVKWPVQPGVTLTISEKDQKWKGLTAVSYTHLFGIQGSRVRIQDGG